MNESNEPMNDVLSLVKKLTEDTMLALKVAIASVERKMTDENES